MFRMVAAIPLVFVFGVALGLLGAYLISNAVYRAMTRRGSRMGLAVGFFTFLICAFVAGFLLSVTISAILWAELSRIFRGISGG